MLSARTRAAPVLVRKSGGAPLLCLEDLITVIGSRRGSDLRLVSPEISGAHAIILNRGGEVYVHDLLSRSGVFVNDEPVRQPRALKHEDEVRVGPFAFQFRAEEDGVLRRPGPGIRTGQPAFLSVDDRLEAVRIDGPLFVIGRRRGADLMVAENSVSSAHAVVVECDGRRFIRDLNSRTGTRVNGERCRQQEISSGDVIRVGKTQFRYQTLTPGDLDDASAMGDAEVTRLGNPESVNPDSSLFGQNLAEGDRALPPPQPSAATPANRSPRIADAVSGPAASPNDVGGRPVVRTAAPEAQLGSSNAGSPVPPASPDSPPPPPPPAGRVGPPPITRAPAAPDTPQTEVLFGGTQFGGLLDPRVIGGVTVVVACVPDAGPGSPEWQPHARTIVLPRWQNDGARPNHTQAAVPPKVRRPAVASPAVQPAPAQPTRMPSASRAAPEPAKAAVRTSDDTKTVTATPGSPAGVDGTATAAPRRAVSAADSPEQTANARRERNRARSAAATADRVDLSLVKGWGALAMATADCELLVHAAASRRFSRQQLHQPPAVYPSRAAQLSESAPGPASGSSLRWLIWGGAAVAFLVLAGLGGYMYWARHGHPIFPGLH